MARVLAYVFLFAFALLVARAIAPFIVLGLVVLLGVCIPPAPPDLNCGDIAFRRFVVLPPDPHGFDGITMGSAVSHEHGGLPTPRAPVVIGN